MKNTITRPSLWCFVQEDCCQMGKMYVYEMMNNFASNKGHGHELMFKNIQSSLNGGGTSSPRKITIDKTMYYFKLFVCLNMPCGNT